MRVKNKAIPRIITPSEMKDGEVGVIINWNSNPEEYIGNIVQMFGTRLITLGSPKVESWGENSISITDPICQIEILPKGTTLEI